jgi:hypothetical protein
VLGLGAGHVSLAAIASLWRGAPWFGSAATENAVLWVVGVSAILLAFGAEATARLGLTAIGAAAAALFVWGLVDPAGLGDALGFDGGLPAAAGILHGLTAAFGLSVGLAPVASRAWRSSSRSGPSTS